MASTLLSPEKPLTILGHLSSPLQDDALDRPISLENERI